MKQILIIISFLLSIPSFAQLNSLKVGDIWPYKNPYVRTIPDSVQLHEFDYNEGLVKVTYNNKIGFLDSSKVIVIPLIYEYGLGANRFINSRSIVVRNDGWGVIDTSGNEVIPLIYGRIRGFDSLYYVSIGNQWGYLDWLGSTILPLGYHKRTCISCKITKEEILQLANNYFYTDSLEKSAPISKEEAILIADKNGYYWDSEFPFNSLINLNTTSNQWVIKCSRYDGVTYEGNCANTNGCAIIKKTLIIIDAIDGKVLEKSKHKSKEPVYE